MEGAIIGERAVIGSCCRILPDSVVAPDAIIPPLCIYGGNPAKLIAKLGSQYERNWKENATAYHKSQLDEVRSTRE
jgi:carbonic anhydrase/acetyltransferase-like protein (isoleucine patch superfamily)